MIRLKVNDQIVEAAEGTTLLACIEKLGIRVPTLCNHKALTPYGGCRLCIVEVYGPWFSLDPVTKRAPTVQASCSYPALDGISVFTDTDRIRSARKIVAELLLARCPDSEVIQRIALEHGVTEPRIKKKYDDCIYCGLCVRMCRERMGRSVVGFTGRGPRKQLEPPFGKHNEMCWACGACNFICPVGKRVTDLTSPKELVPIPDTYNMGLSGRGATSLLYPQAVPNKPAIDQAYCVHLNHDACGICEQVCEADAVSYQQKDSHVELNVGAVILAPGYEPFDPGVKPELGHGRFPNVVTALEFERILSPSGPFAGQILRPSDGKEPRRIAFIQCVGSRDHDRDYCSSVCCMYATKEALIAKEHLGGELACDIYFMDIRAYSKGFEAYFERARNQGVNYIRCRVPVVEEIAETKNLSIRYLTEEEHKVTQEYDLVVLSIGMQPPRQVKEIAGRFGIELNQFDFGKTSTFHPVDSSREAVFLAGPFTEPKDIPETVMQGSAAASRTLALLADARGSLITAKEYPPEIDVTGQEPRVGVFVCHCGTNIAGVVNVRKVVEYARTLSDVAYTENNLYTCSNDTQDRIKELIRTHSLNRVVVASCTPRTHEPLFRNTIREAGLNPYLFEMANIRDQCSWVHMHEPEKATEKAKDLVRMAVAKARLLDPLQPRPLQITRSAMVMGGGIAGITSALELADQGFEVSLVEKEKQLGGSLRQAHYMLNGEKPGVSLDSLIERTKAHKRVHLFTDATVSDLKGSIGNFEAEVSSNGNVHQVRSGVIIVATGAKQYTPGEYLYGGDERVMTQRELEEQLAIRGESFLTAPRNGNKTVVMIQCVGSRDEERPYCSRICCSEAIKNALKIKEISPDTNIYVLYRDVRTYGFRESYYTEARRKGVAFVRYDPTDKPKVSNGHQGLRVEVFDQILRMQLSIPADFLILSAGIIPNEDNKTIAQLLKVPLTQDGFFLEAHMKLRPVDFATDGVFVCGLAHYPKSVEESIIQAQATAARAATILSKEQIELEPIISHVVEENCDGCAYCVEPCPYQAITLVEYESEGQIKKRVEVNEAICKGCGTCMATCPKNAIFVWNFRPEQLSAEVKAALEVPS